MEIVLFIIMGLLVITLLFTMIVLIKIEHCYRLSRQIGQ